MDTALATIVSAIAVAASAAFVVVQLRQAARDRYFAITAHLFEIWQSTEFQEDHLFILHKLPAANWEDFVKGGRGERAERALHRVGGFYDRVGNLIRNGLIRQDDILPTVGGFAIAVWQRIEPIVRELRMRENAFLFQNYETVLPNCRECYVPNATDIATPRFEEPERVTPAAARRLIDSNDTLVLDVSKTSGDTHIKGAVRTEPNDLTGWLTVVDGKDVLTYCT
ncbi:MAG: DUF4760 domain-containing protein [Candidatus Binataceae bacterium]